MTIREHFEQLPEPWSSQAIANTEREDPSYLTENRENDRHVSYVCWAFTWVNSKEGHDYWQDFVENYENTGDKQQ